MLATADTVRRFGTGALLAALISRGGLAQSTRVELGVDGKIEHASGATTVNLPLALFRIGLFVSRQVSVEPFLNVNSSHGGGSITTGRVGTGVLWHFTADTSGVQPYLRPLVEYDFSSVSVANRHTTGGSTAVGVGLGLKLPLADRLRWRIEVAYADGTGNSGVMGLVGLSFFTR